ncbi:Fatty acid desaturase [Tepidimonas sediminis]|uniref:Fatty acid desaturase n=1 Tax=Tepidimonas sediminis TaxID=2588941 RepID=A0A554WUT4_9BURK|nr:fatty acid desaturase [Tepidimonas sediminis]TSE27335.1 Fatty acid desaturase [Tepidimonas sediminis]
MSGSTALPVWRYADGRWPNTLALALVLLGWPLGLWMLGQPGWLVNAAGVALTTLTLTWSAYFLHEFAHQTIFRDARDNERWGTLMTWIHGSCFAPFADLRRKHMRHHTERADVITFDARGFLRRHPWVRRLTLALEWAYIPAVEFLMRGYVIALPFLDERRRSGRRRVLLVGAVRLAFWAAVAWWSLKAVALYALAYLLFIHLLRFADCFQHTYDAYPILDNEAIPQDKVRDRAYEQANTYSDIVGLDARWLNLLWLNFGFHNAHHDRPVEPWYRLPRLHRQLYGEDYPQVVTVRELLGAYHRHRVRRVLADDYGEVRPPGHPDRAAGFIGAVGVSFLTAV